MNECIEIKWRFVEKHPFLTIFSFVSIGAIIGIAFIFQYGMEHFFPIYVLIFAIVLGLPICYWVDALFIPGEWEIKADQFGIYWWENAREIRNISWQNIDIVEYDKLVIFDKKGNQFAILKILQHHPEKLQKEFLKFIQSQLEDDDRFQPTKQ